jgi:hypothetical protein
MFLGVGLLFKEDKPLRMITSPSNYSYLNSSEIEGFRIPVLINKADTYFTNSEYISSISLVSEDTEIPLLLSHIYRTDNEIMVEEDLYYELLFDVQLGFVSNDYFLSMEEAYFDVMYDNGFSVSLYIGEFNYGYVDLNNDDFYLENLMATYDEINGIKTVSGVLIELRNHSNQNIVITHFDILSESVHFNNYYVTKTRDIDLFDLVEEIVGISSYEFYGTDISHIQEVLYHNQSESYYIPLIYENIGHIMRFPIAVHYEINGVENVYYIDDFIFLSTSTFNEEYRSGFRLYEYQD